MRGVVAALICLAMVLGTVPARAEFQTVETENLKITIDSDWANRTAPGYVPVRFDITNLGDARVIVISSRGSRSAVVRSRGMQSGSTDIRQEIRLARGDRVRLTLAVPVLADRENMWFDIRENGRPIQTFSYLGFTSRAAEADASVLFIADAASPFGKASSGWIRTAASLASAVRSGTGPTSRLVVTTGPNPTPTTAAAAAAAAAVAASRPALVRAGPSVDFSLHPSRVPTNWIGYTSLRAVVIGPEEWTQLSDAQKSALLTWIGCGGDLIYVDGDATTLIGATPPAEAGRAGHPYLFGRIHTPTTEELTAAGMHATLLSVMSAKDPNLGLPANGSTDWGRISGRGFRLLIPGIDGVPARAYLGILILFVVLIGPLNYWWLRRRQQLVLVVLTAPAISAVFIILLGGYAVAGQGFSVYGRATTFTVLDQTRKLSATRATTSLYAAGLTPSAGLRVPRDVAVFPIGPEGMGAYGRLALDLSEAQHFTAGVLQARAPTNLEIVGSRPARERLTFTRTADGLSVLNGLDAPIRTLIYRDGTTAYLLDAPLASGAKAIMRAGRPDVGAIIPQDVPLTERYVHLFTHQPAGSYLAVLEHSPFWETGVEALVERGSFHLVLGWPEPQR